MAGYFTVTITDHPTTPDTSPYEAKVKVQSMDNYKGDVDMTFACGYASCAPSTKEISLSSNGSRLITVTLTGTGSGALTATGSGEQEEYDEDSRETQLTIL